MSLEELKKWFNGRELPKELIIDKGTRVTDVKKMVLSHIQVLEHNGEEHRTYLAFKDRLMQVKLMVEAGGQS